MPKPGYCSDCFCTCMSLDIAILTDVTRSEFLNLRENETPQRRLANSYRADCRKCNRTFAVYTPSEASDVESDLFGGDDYPDEDCIAYPGGMTDDDKARADTKAQIIAMIAAAGGLK